jgi:hypothetical protein
MGVTPIMKISKANKKSAGWSEKGPENNPRNKNVSLAANP